MDEEDFDLESFLTKLAHAPKPERARSISRMLLDSAFGEKFSSTHGQNSEREFPVHKWDETQRRVLQAIAACDAVWPEIAYSINMALEIDFDPTQDELKVALHAKTACKTPPAMAPSSESEKLPDLSVDGIRAAVVTLFESFVRSKGLKEELKRFAPYRPHAGKALNFLIDKLDAIALKERQAAAWALGRIGEFAREAAPVLVRKMQEDRDNQYCSLALSEIGLDPSLCETLCDLIEKSEDFAQFRIVRNAISNERLRRWLSHPSGRIRYLAISKLGERVPAQMRMALLGLKQAKIPGSAGLPNPWRPRRTLSVLLCEEQ